MTAGLPKEGRSSYTTRRRTGRAAATAELHHSHPDSFLPTQITGTSTKQIITRSTSTRASSASPTVLELVDHRDLSFDTWLFARMGVLSYDETPKHSRFKHFGKWFQKVLGRNSRKNSRPINKSVTSQQHGGCNRMQLSRWKFTYAAMCLHSSSAVSSPPPKLPVSETYWRLSIMPSFQLPERLHTHANCGTWLNNAHLIMIMKFILHCVLFAQHV